MNKFSIVHISDLHYDQYKHDDAISVLKALRDDLLQYKQINIHLKLLIFSGDLVSSGENIEDYRSAIALLEKYILKPIEIDKQNFVYVPGNHEIQRSNYNRFTAIGLQSELISSNKLNDYIGEMYEDVSKTQTLNNYKKIVDEIHCDIPVLVCNNNMIKAYIYKLSNNVELGIACANSCWNAYGGGDDKNRLMIGSKQIIDLHNAIKEADIKILVMHHPLEWLVEFDSEAVYSEIVNKFDINLYGHNHKPKAVMLDSSLGSYLTNQAGALLPSEDNYYKGYSIIEIDPSENNVEIIFRKYYENRKAFDSDLEVATDGKHAWQLSTSKDPTLAMVFKAKKSIYNYISEDINSCLLSSKSSSLAPKNILEVFVEPPLLIKGNKTVNDSFEKNIKDKKIKLSTIINDNNNYMFVGEKEIGKTTLLNYIQIQMLCNNLNNKVPFYIDSNNLPQGKDIYEKTMSNSSVDLSIHDIKRLLEGGHCVVLIDNLGLEGKNKIKKLLRLINEYPSNKYIFCIEENILNNINLGIMKSLKIIEYETINIGYFREKEIKQLAKKWFSHSSECDNERIKNLIDKFHLIKLPQTPMSLSLFLTVAENNISFSPINESVLLQKYIEFILNRTSLEEVSLSTIDYRFKEDFLSCFAYKAFLHQTQSLTEEEFNDFTLSYFSNKDISCNTISFVKQFINIGILCKSQNNYYFRFRCFYDYFLAIYIINNKEFYDDIISNKILPFSDQLVHVSGLQRTNSDLINNILQLVPIYYDKASQALSLPKELSMLQSDSSILEFINSDLDNVDYENMAEEISNEMETNVNNKLYTKELKQSISFQTENDDIESISFHVDNFMKMLLLLSKAVRNCELIDDPILKKDAFSMCVNHYGKSLHLLYYYFKIKSQSLLDVIFSIEFPHDKNGKIDLTEQKDVIEKVCNDLKVKLRNFFNSVLPLLLSRMLYLYGGTEKLKMIINKLINTSTHEIDKALLLFLKADLNLDSYLSDVDSFVKSNFSHIIGDFCFIKLLDYLTNRDYTKIQRNKIKDLLWSIYNKNLPKQKSNLSPDFLHTARSKDQFFKKIDNLCGQFKNLSL